MRARRPELFSDSEVHQEPQLTRAVFEYHLDTLTNRKQENEFEHFCRKLAEKELCPNLIPQTGPTGGGDSKVDTEMYPVADAISLRWYEGIGRESAQERWAFAFSAKKQWRSKATSDVVKIMGTQRGYKLIYFITNQYVNDKKRSEVEDALRKKHRIDVRILDRGWIIKSVFENNRISLAIDTLRLTGFDEKRHKQTGPRDAERQIELDALEQQIADSTRYAGVEYQLAEDCLQAAILARQLELPRAEVEGRLLRAERIAERVGNQQQMLRVAYAKAWTAFWWYDDFEELSRLYDQVEKLAVGTEQADDLESLTNLWTIMNTAIARGKLDPVNTKFEARTCNLKTELRRLAENERRPNNALQARTSLALMDLAGSAVADSNRRDEVFEELKAILAESEGLGSYPVEPLVNIIREVGEFITDSDSYDALFEYLIELTERRASEAEAGKALLQRGIQKLLAGKNYDAIRLLGRSQLKLAMEEYRGEWITALTACGSAYESAGLRWAARANLLAAANLAFYEFTARGILVPQALRCVCRLVWLEIQLGRVPCVLTWVELMSWAANHLMLEGERRENYQEERMKQDMVLSILLLKTDFWELKGLDFLPAILESLRFDISWMTLLYALGYEDRLRNERMIPEDQDQEATHQFFLKCLKQPATKDIPSHPEFMEGQKVRFNSIILGCEIVVESANNFASIYLSETILSVLEAFMATSINEGVFPHRSDFRLIISPSAFASDMPSHRFNPKEGGGDVEIKHRERLDYHTKEERQAFRSWLIELIAQVIARIFIISDAKDYLNRLARDEAGFHRALDISDISIAVENILGQSPKIRLSDWESDDIKERFPLNRHSAWNEGFEEVEDEETVSSLNKIGQGDPPKDLFDNDKLKHRDIKVFSLINQSLWNKAGWQATAYPYFPNSDQPPFIALGFTDAEAGKAIFEEWLKKIGSIDQDEQLRISIITGIDKSKPFSYKVLIGVNPKVKKGSQSVVQYVLLRVHRMDPPDHINLNRFLEKYNKTGWFVLLPGYFLNESLEPKLFWKHGIAIREITIRPAWQIGENDADVMALQPEDNPSIPTGIEDPPVLEVLNRWAKS